MFTGYEGRVGRSLWKYSHSGISISIIKGGKFDYLDFFCGVLRY